MDINQIISDASKNYHHLVILVGPNNSGKTSALRKFQEHPDTVLINLNLSLSEKLLNHPTSDQQYHITEFIDEIVSPDNKQILLIDNTEILFDPNLNINVLNLFQRISRHQTCIITWTGFLTNGKLVYGEQGQWGYQQSSDVKDIIIKECE